jgi:hypothetical protein
MSSAPILLVLDCGSNVGANVAEAFIAQGCDLALVSRTIPEEESTPTERHIKSRLFSASGVPKIFEEAKEKFGRPPSAVVYN